MWWHPFGLLRAPFFRGVAVRSMETLRRDQAVILAGFRAGREERSRIAQLPRPGTAMAITAYGKVASVVASDATHGPHLVVTRYVWSGSPPVATAAASPDVRCSAAPNHVVGDYAVGDDVRMMVTSGAMIAEPLP